PQQTPARGALLLRERVGRLRGRSRRHRGEAEAERGGAQRESRQDRHGVASPAAGASPFSSAAPPTTSPVRAKSTARMFGSRPRSCWHLLARASRKSWALTMRAFDGFGAGSVSIQWLIWKSDPAVPPRFAAHEKASRFRNL